MKSLLRSLFILFFGLLGTYCFATIPPGTVRTLTSNSSKIIRVEANAVERSLSRLSALNAGRHLVRPWRYINFNSPVSNNSFYRNGTSLRRVLEPPTRPSASPSVGERTVSGGSFSMPDMRSINEGIARSLGTVYQLEGQLFEKFSPRDIESFSPEQGKEFLSLILNLRLTPQELTQSWLAYAPQLVVLRDVPLQESQRGQLLTFYRQLLQRANSRSRLTSSEADLYMWSKVTSAVTDLGILGDAQDATAILTFAEKVSPELRPYTEIVAGRALLSLGDIPALRQLAQKSVSPETQTLQGDFWVGVEKILTQNGQEGLGIAVESKGLQHGSPEVERALTARNDFNIIHMDPSAEATLEWLGFRDEVKLIADEIGAVGGATAATPQMTVRRPDSPWEAGIFQDGNNNLLVLGEHNYSATPFVIDLQTVPKSVEFIDKMFGRSVLDTSAASVLTDADLEALCGGKNTELYRWVVSKRTDLLNTSKNPSANYAQELDAAVNELRARGDFSLLVDRAASSGVVDSSFGNNVGFSPRVGDGREAEQIFSLPLFDALQRNPAAIGNQLLRARSSFVRNPWVRNSIRAVDGKNAGQFVKLMENNGQVLWELEIFPAELIKHDIIPPSSMNMRTGMIGELINRELTYKKFVSKGETFDAVNFLYKKENRDLARQFVQKLQNRGIPIIEEETKDGFSAQVPFSALDDFLKMFSKEQEPLFKSYLFRRSNNHNSKIFPAGDYSQTIKGLLDPTNKTTLNEYVALLNKGTVQDNVNVLKNALDSNLPFYTKYIKSLLPEGKEFTLSVNYRFGAHEIARNPHVHVEMVVHDPSGAYLDMVFNFYQQILFSEQADRVLKAVMPAAQNTGWDLLGGAQPALQGVPVRRTAVRAAQGY